MEWYEYADLGYIICRKCSERYEVGAIGLGECPNCSYGGDQTDEILERLQRIEKSVEELTRMVKEIGRKTKK